eukprot:2101755-Rhodomonas_salina.1
MNTNSNTMQIVDTGCTVVDIVATNVLATIHDECDRDAFNHFIDEDIVNDIVLPHLTMLSCTVEACATDPFSLHARKGVGSRGPQTSGNLIESLALIKMDEMLHFFVE